MKAKLKIHVPAKTFPTPIARTWRSPDGTIVLHQAAAFDLLPELAGVDAIICDPPYGVTDCSWDQAPDTKQLGELIGRAVKPAAVIAMFATQPFANDLITTWRKSFRYELVWRKNRPVGFLNANRQPLRQHELVLIFCTKLGSSTYNPQKTAGKPYTTKAAKEISQVYRSHRPVDHINPGERHPTSVLAFDHDSVRIHPTQKPLALCEWLVKSYTNEGELVADVYFGSAATAVACWRTGRRFVGCERDPEIFARAVARLETETHQRKAAA